ncbi:hypothetical protein C2S51_026340 [Perilla frutescens var. frutescens]|nr:hypothetical protein C2S51_026340 [Perilla frutescens var. frutescens]
MAISNKNTNMIRCNHGWSSASASTEHLQSRFKRRGVSFTGIGDSCVVGMELDNGTAAKLMLPSGLITSFKPQMWHGGTMELLHTSVSESAVIQGGLSLALRCHIINEEDADANSWSPNAWTLHQLTGTPHDSFQLELISSNTKSLQIKQIITLKQDFLNSEVLVSNPTPSPVHLLGSTLCHLAVSTPDAAYAVGLEGSDYYTRPPFRADFTIIPPLLNRRSPSKFWPFNSMFTERDDEGDMNAIEGGGEEEDNYKHLNRNFSRIYTSAPRSFTIIDRGRRNSVTVRRRGFKELYIFSPGSEHECYGKYSYICVGHAAQLEPVILNAESQWSGEVQLLNPNY